MDSRAYNYALKYIPFFAMLMFNLAFDVNYFVFFLLIWILCEIINQLEPEYFENNHIKTYMMLLLSIFLLNFRVKVTHIFVLNVAIFDLGSYLFRDKMGFSGFRKIKNLIGDILKEISKIIFMPLIFLFKKYDAGRYFYLFPAISLIFFFHIMPMFYSFYLSFFKDIVFNPKFVGIQNYVEILSSDMFWKSLLQTVYFVVFSVPSTIFLSLFIAILLNNKIKGLGVYRTIYFLPVITSINAVSIVWNWIYNETHGLMNYFFQLVNLSPQKWLNEPTGIFQLLTPFKIPSFLEGPSLAMVSIIIMSVWKGLGYNVIIFLAGLQNVPASLYEAAKIDGATRWQQFKNITWPMISPVTFFIFVMSMISSFQVFAQVYMMTPTGGPNKSTTVLVFHLYEKGFLEYKIGFANALAFILFAIIFTMTIINKLFVEKKVHYN